MSVKKLEVAPAYIFSDFYIFQRRPRHLDSQAEQICVIVN